MWTACLVFFQTALLLGYYVAHLLVTRTNPRTQVMAYVGLLALSVVQLVRVVDPSLAGQCRTTDRQRPVVALRPHRPAVRHAVGDESAAAGVVRAHDAARTGRRIQAVCDLERRFDRRAAGVPVADRAASDAARSDDPRRHRARHAGDPRRRHRRVRSKRRGRRARDDDRRIGRRPADHPRAVGRAGRVCVAAPRGDDDAHQPERRRPPARLDPSARCVSAELRRRVLDANVAAPLAGGRPRHRRPARERRPARSRGCSTFRSFSPRRRSASRCSSCACSCTASSITVGPRRAISRRSTFTWRRAARSAPCWSASSRRWCRRATTTWRSASCSRQCWASSSPGPAVA